MDTLALTGAYYSQSIGAIGEGLSGLKRDVSIVLLIVLLFSLLASLYFLIILDYRFFLSIGPGGVPANKTGYLRICLLQLIARSKNNVLVPPKAPVDSRFRPYFKHLEALPQRNSPRPRTAGLVPHRQITQKGSNQDIFDLTTALREFVRKNPTTVQEGRSCFEKHSLGLFLTPSLADYTLFNAKNNNNSNYTKPHVVRNPTCGVPPEIAHMHDSEGSLHLTLHPQDAAVVIKQGWGERHPLAGRWLLDGFMLIYAPKGEEELAAVMEIIKAAAWWVGSVDLDI